MFLVWSAVAVVVTTLKTLTFPVKVSAYTPLVIANWLDIDVENVPVSLYSIIQLTG